LRKKTVAFYIGMLLGLILLFTNVTPLRLLDRAVMGVLSLALQGAPNPAPQVIPSLREWQGGSGFFTLRPVARIAVDPSFTAQLEHTAQVFHNDLFAVTGHTLPVVSTASPAAGDFFLTLHTSDPGIGKEGYLLQVDDTVVIRAHTSAGVFYGTRTVLQMLRQDLTKTHLPKGTARDYPQYAERGFMLDVGRKFFSTRVKPAMQTVSQKLWSGTAADMSYDQFLQLAQVIGEAPGTHLPQA
jgi:Glycosyl hydrolase family 20, domain 2